MSSTDVLTLGSIHEDFQGNEIRSPKKKHKHLSPQKITNEISFEVEEEIENLYEYVPEVQKHFKIISKIGEGTFSSVFLANLRDYPEVEQMFALKHIIPTSHPSRIESELRCLQEIGGCDNVMDVKLCLRNRDHVVIVMPYVAHDKFQDYVQILSVEEVREYMKNLLTALRRVHEFDIIHRDVKPSNFLYNRTTKQFALVDFGLAHKAPLLKPKKLSKSPSKKVLQPSKCNSNIEKPAKVEIDSKKKLSEKCIKSSSIPPSREYTPPTPSMDNIAFTRRVRSPRRMLLAKRALMTKDRDDKLGPGNGQRKSSLPTCQCFDQPMVCAICMARGNQIAPRAGTPGFRSPEVLLKCPDQSTAVDMWSAGVIFLSLLTGRYPFFRANDDLTALAQIITIMGSEEVKLAAKTFGKHLICSPSSQPLNVKNLCIKLRQAPSAKRAKINSDSNVDTSNKENLHGNSWKQIPDSTFDLLKKLMDLNPETRISADAALKHPFFTAN